MLSELKTIRLFLFIAVCAVLLSCTDDIITVTISQKELREALPERLQQARIWYRVEEQNKYSFKAQDSAEIVKISREIQAEIIPEGRSSNFGPEIKEIMLRKLQEKDVPYELRQFGEDEWVVWPEEYHAVVVELHTEAEQELLEHLNKIAEEHNRKMLELLEAENKARAKNN